jgi:diadenosine tetraphosphate (Ap4A) HIT family hydrolase
MKKIVDDVLSWELFLEGAKKRDNKMPAVSTLDNRLIFDTNCFFVVAGLGAFVPGYYLIITKSTYTSFAELSDAELIEYNWILNQLSSSINAIYNMNTSVFEHGMCACAGGLDHAHVHVMPAPKLLDENIFYEIINKILKIRAAGVQKIEFNKNIFDNVHDISTILKFNGNYKIVEGKLLDHKDIKNYSGDFGTLRKKLLSTEQYIQFNIVEKKFGFTTSHYLGTQFGRELVFEVISRLDKKSKEKYYHLDISNPTKLLWRWQDYMFEENIIMTMKNLAFFLTKNIKEIDQKKNNFNLFIK